MESHINLSKHFHHFFTRQVMLPTQIVHVVGSKPRCPFCPLHLLVVLSPLSPMRMPTV